MSVLFDRVHKTLTLVTDNTTYQMQIGPAGHLLHLYYGRRAEGTFDHLYLPHDCGFSPNPYELRSQRGWSLDTLPQEYSGSDAGDFRLSSLELTCANGAAGADLRYVCHELRPGKYQIPGLPSSLDPEGEAETLSVILADAAEGVEAELLYGIFPSRDVITRAVRITNTGASAIRLEKAASACLDIPFGRWDLLHFHGRHTMERQAERVPILSGIQSIGSRRGASSHQHNPFVILCDHDAAEDHGECYGMMLVYSGSHKTDIEKDQMDALRAVMGLQDEGFSWILAPGESFFTPEAILTFTHRGLAALSHIYHRFLRNCVCRGPWADRPRPVILNSWEAAYFDFDSEKLLQIARSARELGADMFVLDDGWYGERTDDSRGLGDWFANEKKLPGGLDPLIDSVHAMGLGFGLWIEPEMVNEDSGLFQRHPDWVLTVPGRRPVLGRAQLVLDLSREDVAAWLYDTVSGLLRKHDIQYIKWDMNRHLTDVFSRGLPPDRQGEASHRYMLGLYGVLDRLTREFPQVLIEGCAGGGGRFDAGMLAYCPQIWCSDNTDPISRLAIHYGTSFGYPAAAVSAHISASPNHQTGRSTPLGTRAVAAMYGAFGLELDPGALTDEEAEEIRGHITRYRDCEQLIRTGDYYRLTAPGDNGAFTAWQFVSEDKRQAMVSFVFTAAEGNPKPAHIRLKGLSAGAVYRIVRKDVWGGFLADPAAERNIFTGSDLMYGGYILPALPGDYPGGQIILKQEN